MQAKSKVAIKGFGKVEMHLYEIADSLQCVADPAWWATLKRHVPDHLPSPVGIRKPLYQAIIGEHLEAAPLGAFGPRTSKPSALGSQCCKWKGYVVIPLLR
ncbi:hypothetical protein MUK42_19097 [Musa troglodytarum]|uniref:Uncharacterized protein n=1 Tax=Musa troglodytarum TaxID=320322 RepID=A0A9E7JQL0_9LILI|nr:hypothetical protein MUK42_19097 [Musa troglodytarum]